MRTLTFLIQKEFRQIFRDPILLRMIFALPIVQLIILPLAADYEIKNINIAVVDGDHSQTSRRLTSDITASGYFKLAFFGSSYQEAFSLLEKDRVDIILEIPAGFERNLVRENHQKVLIAINAINGTKANVGGAYLGRIIQAFNATLRAEIAIPDRFGTIPTIEIANINWFNPFLNYRFFMVPGILAFLVTMIGTYMTALNIVKEKEVGTIEQINVTPIKKIHFILGKMIPFWIIGIVVFSFGLFVVARLVYGIIPLGSVVALYAFLMVYLVAVLGIGLLISTYAATQQQAMSLAFFIMMIFLLMSGLFTSIDAMPFWARIIAALNPVTYFIDVMRMMVMKGSGFPDIARHFAVMIGFALFFNTWAVLNYKKQS